MTMTVRALSAVPALALGVLLAASCSGTGAGDKCEGDNQCDLNFTCDLASGECLCMNDAACRGDNNGFCNPAGRCQPRSGCFSNKDCQADATGAAREFCDVTTNTCQSVEFCDPEGGESCCTLDSQCGFGSICEPLSQRCIPGCRDDGDCRLGEGCIKEGIVALGQCAAGVCTANNLCDYGEICDIEAGECQFDTRGPYCYSCTGGVASDDCGTPGNYCLTDSTDPTGQSSFCGVDCSQNQACPFGYECHDVIIIPQTLPFCAPPEACEKAVGAQTGICSRNGGTCVEDEDCPEGPPGSDCPRWNFTCNPGVICPGGSECPESGVCPPFGHCIDDQSPCEDDVQCCDDPEQCPKGSCVLQRCVGGEGDAFGHCTCTIDSDCPRDECDGQDLSDPDNPVYGNCALAGHACLDDIDCDVIACVEGGCRIGANCAPANDRSCREILDPP